MKSEKAAVTLFNDHLIKQTGLLAISFQGIKIYRTALKKKRLAG